MNVVAFKSQCIDHHLYRSDCKCVRRIGKRYLNVFLTFGNDGECLLTVIRTIKFNAGILELFFCFCNEFLTADIEYDSVNGLEIKSLVVNVYDLCKSISCGVGELFFIGKILSDVFPVSLC